MTVPAQEIVEKYLAAWNEKDVTRRRAAVAALFTEHCEYTDPLAAVQGPAAIEQLIASVQKQLPGFKFSLAGKVDAHHDQARFSWHAAPEGAREPVVIGFDVLRLEAGRIQNVLGFLDRVPG